MFRTQSNVEPRVDCSQLARRVSELAERLQTGEDVDLREFCRDAPEQFEQLEMLLPTLQAVVDFEHNSNSGTSSASEGSKNRTHNDDSPDLRTHTLGDFRILRELGRGGMGIVYEAEQLSLGRKVALKVLPFASMLDKQQLARFKNEARAAATLDHPNIVAIYSVGTERGVHYYAMQLIEGQSLAQVIEALRGRVRDQTPPPHPTGKGLGEGAALADTRPVAKLSTLPDPTSREYFRAIAKLGIQAAEALDHAHQNGILHRDVKPGNLLVDDSGKLWVTDFGLARIETEAGMTMTGDVLGTLRYMSPEQAIGKRAVIDHRSDVYSLGLTLYELLTLRPAFAGDDRPKLLLKIAAEEPTEPRQINPRIPQDLETIVLKAIEKDAADRYESAGELAADLRRFVEDRPILARRPTLAANVRRWARRHAGLITLSAFILLIAVAGLATSTFLIRREAKRAEANLNLALVGLEETLAESIIGDRLLVEPMGASRIELQRRGIQFYEEFANRNGTRPSQWPTYRRLVFHQRLNDGLSLKQHDLQAAIVAFEDAITLGEQLVAVTNGNATNQARLINSICDYSFVLGEANRFDDALAQSTRVKELINRLKSEQPEFKYLPFLQGRNLYNRAVYHEHLSQVEEAERLCREAIPHLEKALKIEPDEILIPQFLTMCRYNLGLYLAQRGEAHEATELWHQSRAGWEALATLRPTSSEFQSRLGATYGNLAMLAKYGQDYELARTLAEKAVEHQKLAFNLPPVYVLAKDFLRQHYKVLSQAIWELQDHKAIAALAEERIEQLSDVPWDYSEAAISLAKCVERLDEWEVDAETRAKCCAQYSDWALEVLATARELFDYEAARVLLANSYREVGDHLAKAGRENQALASWQASREIYRELRGQTKLLADEDIDRQLTALDDRFAKLTNR